MNALTTPSFIQSNTPGSRQQGGMGWGMNKVEHTGKWGSEFWEIYQAPYKYGLTLTGYFINLGLLLLTWEMRVCSEWHLSLSIIPKVSDPNSVLSCFSRVQLCNPKNCRLPGSSVHNSPDKNTGMGALLQGIFLTQGLNLCLLWLLDCRWILYCWATGEVHDPDYSKIEIKSMPGWPNPACHQLQVE